MCHHTNMLLWFTLWDSIMAGFVFRRYSHFFNTNILRDSIHTFRIGWVTKHYCFEMTRPDKPLRNIIASKWHVRTNRYEILLLWNDTSGQTATKYYCFEMTRPDKPLRNIIASKWHVRTNCRTEYSLNCPHVDNRNGTVCPV